MHPLFGLPLLFIIAFLIYIYYHDKKHKKFTEDNILKIQANEELTLDDIITKISLLKEDRNAQ